MPFSDGKNEAKIPHDGRTWHLTGQNPRHTPSCAKFYWRNGPLGANDTKFDQATSTSSLQNPWHLHCPCCCNRLRYCMAIPLRKSTTTGRRLLLQSLHPATIRIRHQSLRLLLAVLIKFPSAGLLHQLEKSCDQGRMAQANWKRSAWASRRNSTDLETARKLNEQYCGGGFEFVPSEKLPIYRRSLFISVHDRR